MNSFRLFWRAVKSTRHEMWISLQVLVATTLVLSLALYLVEHNAQPDIFRNYWDALLWSSMGYIGDPGEFATYTPITFWGRILKIACAIVNIAIFAVPAGLVAGGFSDAIADDKRNRELDEMRRRLEKAFRRKQDKATKLRTVPRYVPLVTVQVMQQIDTKDIIDAVRASDNLRLCNLASAKPESDNPADRLVIEEFPRRGRTAYGCCIDRGSRVTIIAPTASNEVGIGNFAYYVALFGGFNYISKEYDENTDEPRSYYLLDDEQADGAVRAYLHDIRRLTRGDDRWAIALIAADSVHPEKLHFVTSRLEKAGGGSTLIRLDDFARLYESMAGTMLKEFGLESELDRRYRPAGVKNVTVRIGGGRDCNAFTIRVDWGIVAFDNRHVAIAYAMARQIAAALEGRTVEPSPQWKQDGCGY